MFNSSKKKKKRKKKTLKKLKENLKIPIFSRALYRTLISDWKAALLATSLLKDVGLVTANNKEKVIDPNNVLRDKMKLGEIVVQETAITFVSCEVKVLYFDDR